MVKLFSRNSNLCDHNSPTLQTDRQTDRQTTCDRNTALCTKVHRAVIKRNLGSLMVKEICKSVHICQRFDETSSSKNNAVSNWNLLKMTIMQCRNAVGLTAV